MTDVRSRLLDKLRRDAYREGTFTLASGKTSDFFIDCKAVMLSAEGHSLCAEALLALLDVTERASSERASVVAGVALGGCPLASALSLLSFQRGQPRDALYVRKESKDHGTRSLIEGRAAPGSRVVLLEDVMTTGASSKLAIERLQSAGYVVSSVLALVDREEGAAAAIRALGIEAHALFTRGDFVK
ncbi:MAG: orotate phosphoribosyltransferase [Deltaproteobacteria bacterium]|nr:orotate phosphoribosyltransferase [Deltaproteobacteria bacterium]